MPLVTFLNRGTRSEIQFDPETSTYAGFGRPGSLLDIAMQSGVPLEHACGGNASCTTCHVYVRSGMENLSALEEPERDRLAIIWDLTEQSRLGCQALVRGDVVAEIPS
jgi:2Fe-2S ferredoxin